MLAPGILNLFTLLQSRYTNLKSGAFQTVQSYTQWTEYNVCLTHLAWMLALKPGILGNAFLKLIFIHKKFLFRYTMRKVYAPLARHKQKWDKSCSLYVRKERLCLRDFSCHSLSPNLVKHFKLHPSPVFLSTLTYVDLCCTTTTWGILKRFSMGVEKLSVDRYISQYCHLKMNTPKNAEVS